MRIEPTVGRTILLWLGNPDGIPVKIGEPLCAQIAAVLPNGNINIGFLDYQGHHRHMENVAVAQSGESTPAYPFCGWMDYQVGQARKDAADEPGSVLIIGGGAPLPQGNDLFVNASAAGDSLTIAPQGSIIEQLAPSDPLAGVPIGSAGMGLVQNESTLAAEWRAPVGGSSEPGTQPTTDTPPADPA